MKYYLSELFMRKHSANVSNYTYFISSGLLIVITVGVTSCQNPVRLDSDAQIQSSLQNAASYELSDSQPRDIWLTRSKSELQARFSEERLTELEGMAGASSYDENNLVLGNDLTGQEFKTFPVNLQEAIANAINNNLSIQVAGFSPAQSSTQITLAESQFDSLFFTNIDLTKTDQPTPISSFSGFATGTGSSVNDNTSFSSGLRKKLVTGGELEIGTRIARSENRTPNQFYTPNPSYTASLEMGIKQPLLRGAGSRVNLSQVRLNRNAHRSAIEKYRLDLLNLVLNTEQAYWNLVLSRRALEIQERLLERGKETERKVIGRETHDATPAEVADAISRVQSRQTQVTRSRNDVLISSDRLKQLMNAPGYPVGGEVMIIPVDKVIDAPIQFNYVDSIKTALNNRPEIQQALLLIDDSSIRQMFADNLRLPKLDISASVRWIGLDDGIGDAYGGITDDDYIDYILGVVFELPLGNREAQANYRMSQLQRLQSVIGFRQVVQGVCIQVKEALRQVNMNYELLERTKDARIAAAESLRTYEVKEKYGAPLTPDFLNLKLNRQEALASAELQEARALIEYQVALSTLYHAIGVGLERNNIEFVVPEIESQDAKSY